MSKFASNIEEIAALWEIIYWRLDIPQGQYDLGIIS